MQTANEIEASKDKSLAFHRSPVGNNMETVRVHVASTYMAELLSKEARNGKVQTLKVVVAALSVTQGYQSAYGDLYEGEFHRIMFDGPTGKQSMVKKLKYLGVHSETANDWAPKDEPTMDFGREDVLHFPGNSVTNARLRASDDPPNIYFHPLTDSYPTHDSFIVCAASVFFAAKSGLSPIKKKEVEALLAAHVVVVGLQQTVSGSDEVDCKPSHSVVGQRPAPS